MADPAADVQLTDLQVIQEFSLAVRAATAPREVVIEALEADLAWLRGPQAAAEPTVRKAPRARKATSRRQEA